MALYGRVARTERLTREMVRVVLGGEGLAGFETGPFTDSYVKLVFPLPDVVHPEPFDLREVRASLPRERWPRTRTYTVRSWDPAARELTIDFVVHGDDGIAGPWAAKAQPGDVLHFAGPGGGYAPSAEASWHLLAGDESAWPAIAAAVEALPAGARATVLVEVEGPADEQVVRSAGEVDLRWLHRAGGPRGRLVVDAVRGLEFPADGVQVFVHGEATMVKELRGHLKLERGVARERMSISGYWRLGADEDGWQSSKGEWNRQVEQEQG
ncbi:siderophore-interacting protein [Saccharothrix longispora]|uniref:NADPH-dependent ferric siderophore reductase n=1 Tax=Saccharothrix longispora TaxID=33920 RepID=A0ABU1PWZ3_9PSEU|nr:siderophore-interacting protein [Saccharothrix longispora]MDR6595152.1 NADPH-dependent ferric siderophore reductase [Saccharothrix longispora]